jgi:hypothetical protein
MSLSATFNELHLAVSEVNALATIASNWFDEQAWYDADTAVVGSVALMLGLQARSAMRATSELGTFESVLVSAQHPSTGIYDFPEDARPSGASPKDDDPGQDAPTEPNLAAQFDVVSVAVSEVDVLATILAAWFGDQDWAGADQFVVESIGLMLCVLARAASTASSKVLAFESALADLQAASRGEWDLHEDTPVDALSLSDLVAPRRDERMMKK